MLRIRVRLRTLMIIVAVVALLLVVVMQGVYLKRAEVRMEVQQAEAANARGDRAAVGPGRETGSRIAPYVRDAAGGEGRG